MLRGARLLGPGVAAQVKGLLSPVNIGITVGTLALWATAHIYGVGEAFDLLALVVGVGFVGWGFWDGFKKLVSFAVTATQAQSDGQLNDAALFFRDAVIELGVSTILALIMKRPLAGAISKPGRITQINLRPGLVRVPPPPAGSGITIDYVGPSQLPPGAGASTDVYGNIKVLKNLSYREQMKQVWHEEVHSAVAPKSALLRQYRAHLMQSASSRSVFLRYLEEAVAETRSLIKETKTFEGGSGVTKSNLLGGMRYPLADNRYAVLARVAKTQAPIVSTDIATQGWMVGTILVEGEHFAVYITQGSQNHAPQN